MAAHLLTGLIQAAHSAIVRPSEKLAEELKPALEFLCWTEDMTLDGYRKLASAVEQQDADAIFEALVSELPGAVVEWKCLGRPATREEWRWHKVDSE